MIIDFYTYNLKKKFDNYWTSAETKTYVDDAIADIDLSGYTTTAQTEEIERVTSRALNELHDSLSGKQETLVSGENIKTINGNSILGSGNIELDLSGYTTTAQTEELKNKLQVDEETVSKALNELHEDKVSSTSIRTIVKLTQAEYDALTTKDENTLYCIVG